MAEGEKKTITANERIYILYIMYSECVDVLSFKHKSGQGNDGKYTQTQYTKLIIQSCVGGCGGGGGDGGGDGSGTQIFLLVIPFFQLPKKETLNTSGRA